LERLGIEANPLSDTATSVHIPQLREMGIEVWTDLTPRYPSS